jgi:hypothetical protein
MVSGVLYVPLQEQAKSLGGEGKDKGVQVLGLTSTTLAWKKSEGYNKPDLSG